MVDTNVILRLLLADVKGQAEKARALFGEVEKGKKKIYVSLLVVGELVWILERYYEIKRSVFVEKVLAVMAMKNVKLFEGEKKVVLEALRAMLSSNLDFTDLYLIKSGVEVMSFDRKLNKRL